uniref:Uncharacterized protein n=1 Tax=Arundo donax TaxID=35708 RepID=A0A0A9CR61_ARUDO
MMMFTAGGNANHQGFLLQLVAMVFHATELISMKLRKLVMATLVLCSKF